MTVGHIKDKDTDFSGKVDYNDIWSLKKESKSMFLNTWSFNNHLALATFRKSVIYNICICGYFHMKNVKM